MLDSIWRVGGNEFDVDSFLKKYPISIVDDVYHKGEMNVRKIPYKNSGFVATISENINSLENISEIQKFIQTNQEALSYLKSLGVSSEIDIGCTVGTTNQFTKSITATPALLGLLHQYSISLMFSAYPASEEKNET